MDAHMVTRTGQSTSRGRRTRVLIAEDDDSLRMLMRIAIDVGGLDIVEACDGISALELARENPPDLVLLAIADLRPDTTIAFRTGPRAVVHAAGTGVAAGHRYARLAGLPFRRDPEPRGLASWTAAARPGTATITVELPGERVSARQASRLAYAIDRLAGTRFAAGAMSERRDLIAHGRDPRVSWH